MSGLRNRLQAHLPDYLVPSAMMVLESLPMTANGKVDREALPVPAGNAWRHREYEAPRDEIGQAAEGSEGRGVTGPTLRRIG